MTQHQIESRLDRDLADIVRRQYPPLQRQASGPLVIVVLTLFCATVYLLARIVAN